MDLFRFSKIPLVYTDLYDRLTPALSSSEAEQIIKAIAQKNGRQVLVIFADS